MRDLNTRNSPLLRARVRTTLGLPALPTFDVPGFILPAPKGMLRLGDKWEPSLAAQQHQGTQAEIWACDFSLPFWALRGQLQHWWSGFLACIEESRSHE